MPEEVECELAQDRVWSAVQGCGSDQIVVEMADGFSDCAHGLLRLVGDLERILFLEGVKV